MIDSLVEKKSILQAIKVLQEVTEKYYNDSSKKKPLLEEETKSPLLLQVTLKKIPKSKNIKMIRVNLPHSIVKDTSDVCLITGDLDKKNRKAEIEPDLLHYKELLNKNGISEISEIITLRQLRTEYKPFEAKLKLLAAYDVFLADSVILECLPKILGSHFFKKRKYPIRINMKAKNLKKEISKAISSKIFYITGRGNSCTAEIAYLDMEKKNIVANVFSVVETLSKELPGAWDNILGIYLKTAKSVAVPIYMSNDNPNDVKLPVAMEENEFEIDELTTIPNALVKVYKDGSVETVKNSIIHKSQVEEPKVKESDLDSSSPNSDEEVAQSKMDIASQKKVTTKSLTLAEDTSIVETKICDEPDTKKPKKEKRKSIGQLPISEDNYSAETSVQTSIGVKEFEVCDEADKKKSNKKIRKSVGQLPVSKDICSAETSDQTSIGLKEFQVCDELDTKKSIKRNRKSVGRLPILEDIYSAETSIQTNIGLKEFELEVCDEPDTKRLNKRNRKSVGQGSISEDNCTAEAQISAKGLKVVNEMEEESKNSKKSKRKRTESESEFPIFGKLESKPQFIRSQKKIKLDDSEVKNALERKQKRNKKKQNQRKPFVKK